MRITGKNTGNKLIVVLLGLALHSGLNLVTVKLGIVFIFIYVTSPTAAHALVKAAYSRGLDAPNVEDATLSTGPAVHSTRDADG